MGKKSKSKAAVERAKPEVVTVGGKEVIVGGRWNNAAMADYIIQHGTKDWIGIGQLARIGCGSNTIPTKRRARSRLSQLFMTFLSRGMFLAIDYGGDHNSAMGVKVADIHIAEDHQNVEFKLERMRKRKELSQEQYDRTITLLNAAIAKKGEAA